jgi:hypothetical protein
VEVSWQAVARRRLLRQGLTHPIGTIEAAVLAMVGAHAQIMTAAELSISVRTSGMRAADVRAALAPGGGLVKTYGPRGTVHLLSRADLPRWCAALDEMPSTTSLPESARLTPDQQEDVIAAIDQILATDAARVDPPDGDELGATVIQLTGPWAGDAVTPAFGAMWPRWRQAIGAAAHRGVLAFGNNRGNRVTYVSPGITVDVDTDNAVRWLILQFLQSYGPATSRQFARWLGIRPAQAHREFQRFSRDLTTVQFAGEDAFIAADDEESLQTAEPRNSAHRVHLLPHFDPYVIGSFPRELVFPGIAADRALSRGQAGTLPVVLIDGSVRGIWHAKKSNTSLDLTVESFDALAPRQLVELERETVRIGAFLDLEPRFTLAAVSTRAHL